MSIKIRENKGKKIKIQLLTLQAAVPSNIVYHLCWLQRTIMGEPLAQYIIEKQVGSGYVESWDSFVCANLEYAIKKFKDLIGYTQ